MMHLDVTGAPTQGRVGIDLHLGHIPGVGRIVHLGRTPVGTYQHPEQPIDHSPRKEYAPAGIPTRDTCRGNIFSACPLWSIPLFFNSLSGSKIRHIIALP